LKSQLEKFEKGTSFVNIVSAVTENELHDMSTMNEDYANLNCIKFIPASGAATRMFKDLYAFLDDGVENDITRVFFEKIELFPFYNELEAMIGSEVVDKKTTEGRIRLVETLLNEGLDYGSLPKALLRFHQYTGSIATPIDEHVFEGKNYLNSDKVKLHFTISKEHEILFNDYVRQAIEGKHHIEVTYSFQKKETDTLAVDMKNQPFLLEDGEVLYRAGGHGSLIENLNDLDGDVIFVKNIDNVCHQSKVKDTIESKKKLASIGFHVKQKIDRYMQALLNDDFDLDEINGFLNETLNITLKKSLTKELALDFLDRPLRVCGMVRNQGEPGGGPFVVDNGEYTDLQICEKAEIDLSDKAIVKVLNDSTFFNPVDLVCYVRNHQGEKYNLLDYVLEDRYFISEKSYKGRQLKALEHPGLWNGAMHNWNTVFVEVPLLTFNPVKTVNDLLREGHVGG